MRRPGRLVPFAASCLVGAVTLLAGARSAPAQTCGALGGDYCSQTASCPNGYVSLGPSSDCQTCCRSQGPPTGPSCGDLGGDYCSQTGSCPAGYDSLGPSFDCNPCCRRGPSCGALGGDYCSQTDSCPADFQSLGLTYDCRTCCKRQAVCGDGVCTPVVEGCGNCPGDCPCPPGTTCLNGQCQAPVACGDGVCTPYLEGCGNCPEDCPCSPGTSCRSGQCEACQATCPAGCPNEPTFTVSDPSPRVGQDVVFTARASLIDEPSPAWDLGNGEHLTSGGNTLVYRYPAAGTFAARLTASESVCHTVQVSAPTTITVRPLAQGDDAELVATNLPASLDCDSTYDVQATLRNTGTTTWTGEAGYAAALTLDDHLPDPRPLLSPLPTGLAVAPGETHTFDFVLDEHRFPGSYVSYISMAILAGLEVQTFGAAAVRDLSVSCGLGCASPGCVACTAAGMPADDTCSVVAHRARFEALERFKFTGKDEGHDHAGSLETRVGKDVPSVCNVTWGTCTQLDRGCPRILGVPTNFVCENHPPDRVCREGQSCMGVWNTSGTGPWAHGNEASSATGIGYRPVNCNCASADSGFAGSYALETKNEKLLSVSEGSMSQCFAAGCIESLGWSRQDTVEVRYDCGVVGSAPGQCVPTGAVSGPSFTQSSCDPLSCGPGLCGTVPDFCGGSIDCGACPSASPPPPPVCGDGFCDPGEETTCRRDCELPVCADGHEPPMATPVAPASAYVGQSLTMGATSSNPVLIASYTWSFGDGSNGQGAEVTHAYTAPALYTVKLTVADSSGCRTTSSTQINVEARNTPPTVSWRGRDSCVAPCAVLLTADAHDADGDTLEYAYSGCTPLRDPTVPPHSCLVRLPLPGSYTATVTVTDHRGGITTASKVVAGLTNTPSGLSVSVRPADLETGATPVQVTFPSVARRGMTRLVITGSGPEPPAGFETGTPRLYYDLQTTAVTSTAPSSPAQVCVTYAGTRFMHETEVRLFHFSAGAWADVTSSRDPMSHTVCGAAATLSPFLVVEPPNRLPTAQAGPPQVVECASHVGGRFRLEGAGLDPDGDPLQFEWRSGAGEIVARSAQAELSLPPGTYPFTLTVSDGLGGVATASTAVLVRDTSPPSLSLSTTSMTVVLPTASVRSTPVDLTGIASASDLCDPSVVVTDDAPARFPLGPTTVTFTARDASGQIAQGALTVRVVYRFSGFLRPLREEDPRRFHAGRPLPVMFKLKAADGSTVRSAVATLRVFRLEDGGWQEVAPIHAEGGSKGNRFRFQPGTGRYVYRLRTAGLDPGRYLLRAEIDDATVHEVEVSLRRHEHDR